MDTKNQISRQHESVLVMAASKGDLDAFNQLVLEYQNLIYNYIYSLLGEPESAEDITQESFIKAYQKLNSFRGGSFRSWLMRIATNSAYDFLRVPGGILPSNSSSKMKMGRRWILLRGLPIHLHLFRKFSSKMSFQRLYLHCLKNCPVHIALSCRSSTCMNLIMQKRHWPWMSQSVQ